MKFEEEASLVGRYLGCSVAARFDAAASDSDAEPPPPAGRRRRSCRGPPPRIWTCGSCAAGWANTRTRSRPSARAASSDLVFIDDDDLDLAGHDARGAGGDTDPRRVLTRSPATGNINGLITRAPSRRSRGRRRPRAHGPSACTNQIFVATQLRHC